MDELLSALTTLVEDASPASVERIADAFDNITGGGPTMPSDDAIRTPQQAAQVQALIRAWMQFPNVSPQSIALALRSIQHAITQRDQTGDLELMWTGPIAGRRTVRRTDEALYDLVRSAQESLTIVTFAAYHVPELEAALREASRRDVRIRLILEFAEESGGKVLYDPLHVIGRAVPNADVYYWPIDQRVQDSNGRHGTLHAKCAIADRAITLLSSANLTGDALERNMELGALMHDREIAEEIEAHFDDLIESDVLRRFQNG